MWQELGVALAMVLVIEGIMPFVNPVAYRETMQRVAQMTSRNLRTMGLVSMLSGVAMLYFIK